MHGNRRQDRLARVLTEGLSAACDSGLGWLQDAGGGV